MQSPSRLPPAEALTTPHAPGVSRSVPAGVPAVALHHRPLLAAHERGVLWRWEWREGSGPQHLKFFHLHCSSVATTLYSHPGYWHRHHICTQVLDKTHRSTSCTGQNERRRALPMWGWLPGTMAPRLSAPQRLPHVVGLGDLQADWLLGLVWRQEHLEPIPEVVLHMWRGSGDDRWMSGVRGLLSSDDERGWNPKPQTCVPSSRRCPAPVSTTCTDYNLSKGSSLQTDHLSSP